MSGFLGADYGGGGTTHHHHTQFIFPILKSGEILQCMAELGIAVTKIELTEPQRHREKTKQVFWQLLDTCCGITEEDLVEKPIPLQNIKYPELHQDTFVDVLFFKQLQDLMTTCGVYDFSWRDFHFPTSKRYRVQLSAIINMAKFREEQLKVYAELNEPRAQLLLTLEEIHKEHDLLEKSLQQAQAESNVQMDELDIILNQCQDLESEIAKSNKLQASKREKAALLKRQANDLKDELASATWALQEAQAEEENYSSKIVSSPSRRKTELAHKKSSLEKLKQETKTMQQDIANNKALSTKYQTLVAQVNETMTLQTQVIQEAENYNQGMVQVNAALKEVDQNKASTKELEEKAEQAERTLHRTEEKLSHTRLTGDQKMEAAQDRLQQALDQLKRVEQERRQGMERVKAGEQEVSHLRQVMEESQQECEQEISILIAEYKEMEKAFTLKNERRMQMMETLSC